MSGGNIAIRIGVYVRAANAGSIAGFTVAQPAVQASTANAIAKPDRRRIGNIDENLPWTKQAPNE